MQLQGTSAGGKRPKSLVLLFGITASAARSRGVGPVSLVHPHGSGGVWFVWGVAVEFQGVFGICSTLASSLVNSIWVLRAMSSGLQDFHVHE